MTTPDMDVIKDIPGYKVILKAVLRSQIQQLVEQLASTTDEESVVLTASVADGSLCHLGSDSGKVFLEDHEDFKSQFLGFCLKRHHKKQLEKERREAQEREEALARSMQAVTSPPYATSGPRHGFMAQRSPRYPSPRQQGIHPMAFSQGPGGPLRSPVNRHQPYPSVRPTKQSQKQNQVVQSTIPTRMIKIEPDDSSNHSTDDTSLSDSAVKSSVHESSHLSPSAKSSTPTHSQGPATSDNDDAISDTSSSTIPVEAAELKLNDSGLTTQLSLDSDLSGLVSDVPGADSSVNSETGTQAAQSENESSVLDPSVSVKLEEGADSEMDLEITGVELGQGQLHNQPDWLATADSIMQGATGVSTDEQPYSFLQRMDDSRKRYRCDRCGRSYSSKYRLSFHVQNIHEESKKSTVCKWCGNRFSNVHNLAQHVANVHMGLKRYACDHCEKNFSNRRDLNNHIRHQHSHEKLVCTICRKEFSYSQSLQRHMVACTTGRTVPCSICNKKFKTKDAAAVHKKAKHTDIVTVCEICGKRFERRSTYKRHMDGVHNK